MCIYWRDFVCLCVCVCVRVPFSNFNSTRETGKSCDTNFTPVERTTNIYLNNTKDLTKSVCVHNSGLSAPMNLASSTEQRKPLAEAQRKRATSLAPVKDRLVSGKARFTDINSQGSREDETIPP